MQNNINFPKRRNMARSHEKKHTLFFTLYEYEEKESFFLGCP
jgi:hypothetical protein